MTRQDTLDPSLARRARFADGCRLTLDRIRLKLGRTRRMQDTQWFYYASVLVFDAIEALRTFGPVHHPGRPHTATLASPACLDQTPEYRAYWYDRERHAMVGALLGLDLHRFEGKYYALECNLTAGLMAERRALYDGDLDPLIPALIGFAKRYGFCKIVLQRKSWRQDFQQECSVASKRYGIDLELSSTMRADGDPSVNPAVGLPRDLEPNTLYIVATALSESAVYYFLHQKSQFDRWLRDALQKTSDLKTRLAAVPSNERPGVPVLSDDPRWPNHVVKLASSDEGRDVLFGKFSSAQAACEALGLPETGDGIPSAFKKGVIRSLVQRLFPKAFSAIYQSFVPPENEDGYPKMIRMEVFISPLEDVFLSAHGTVGGKRIPKAIPEDEVLKASPLNVSVPPGRFVLLNEDIEAELTDIARDFGVCARTAINAKFRTTPSEVDETGKR